MNQKIVVTILYVAVLVLGSLYSYELGQRTTQLTGQVDPGILESYRLMHNKAQSLQGILDYLVSSDSTIVPRLIEAGLIQPDTARR